MEEGNNRYIVQVFVGALSQHYEALSVEASKQTTSEEIVLCIAERLSLCGAAGFELAEVVGDALGRECKERRLGPAECPVAVMLLWPKTSSAQQEFYRFYLREKLSDNLWSDGFTMDPQLIRDYFYRFLYQPQDREYPDLCQLPDLNEQTLLENLRSRFLNGHIYTYVGSILIAVNPFKFHPIYNPKYVKLYQHRRLGPELPPHIFAVADSAYHSMLRSKRNQCIVISGESGSGKTESTNLLLHHLTALSQKGAQGSGVEQTILSAGPVLEAFGNAKTAHNNNSSRFGKFIQVNYKPNGMVHGAVVQKYLLEKSRICSQGRNERNYHVFYYLLKGASEDDRTTLHLRKAEQYNYLNRSGCFVLENVDENHEFSRLKQSMEMVGFTPEKQRRLFAVLSAVLLLGNVELLPRKSVYHHDEGVAVGNTEVVDIISRLLRVKRETLLAALTAKRARASGETLVINYRLPEAIAARDAMAKCLYGALFDWIVLQVNHALLSKKDTLREHQGNSIGVLDIFGFEDFGPYNSFEQLCINYANEHLQYYFNQHVFKYEQEEYRKEGIRWSDIDFLDNTACLHLIEAKPSGLLCLLDDECNFPGASNETLLQKFNLVHKDNAFYEMPHKREPAFIVRHYAGRVKYQVAEMREKNLDLMRTEMVGVLKNSSMAFVRELVGADPVAVFRWAILRAFFRAHFAFNEAGRRHRQFRDGSRPSLVHNRYRNENLIRLYPRYGASTSNLPTKTKQNNDKFDEQRKEPQRNNRFSWPNQQPTNQTTNKQRTPDSDKKPVFRRAINPEDAKVFERATQIVMKNKSFRPRQQGKKGLKNLESIKTLAGRTQTHTHKARKQPLTVTAQFQQSLHSLMDTLNQANPFFIRCIKSNAEKIPNTFDDDTVQRQLRYTGMLETVRIRQAGYNVRLTFDEFIQLYRILLPRGLLSSQNDVKDFLLTVNLNRDNYQVGSSKIFMRESEKLKLDYKLHQQIMAGIVKVQRWFRAVLERRRFVRLKEAVVTIQAYWRGVLARKQVYQDKQWSSAAVQIQSAWRAYSTWRWYQKLKRNIIEFQAHARGYITRNRVRSMVPRKAKLTNSRPPLSTETSHEDVGSRDSESSGVHEDSDNEQNHEPLARRNQQDDTLHEIRVGDPNKEIQTKKKLSPRRSKNTFYLEDSSLDAKERKGSSDSLTSTRSSDSQVRDTLYRAKRQIQALMGVGANKKTDTLSDCEMDDVREPLYHPMIVTGRAPTVDAEPLAPTRLARRRDNAQQIPSQLDLKRRNSDPANRLPPPPAPPPPLPPLPSPDLGLLEWKGTSMFTIAGHNFCKEGRFSKEDRCAYCDKPMDAFLTQGHKCIDCKALFHPKCIQNGGVLSMPCVPRVSGGRKKHRKMTRSHGHNMHGPQSLRPSAPQQQLSQFSLTGTSEFTDRADRIISDVRELQLMQDFITTKIYKIESGDKQSQVDRVFKQALREFKDNLVATYSVVNKQGPEALNIKYKDLIANFLRVMETVCTQEQTKTDFPVTMGVNAFRGFLNEFMAQTRVEQVKPHKTKRKKEKKRKTEDPIAHAGHHFVLTIINIPTACEICTSFFMWPLERGLVCQNCKLTCHKKCYTQVGVCRLQVGAGGVMSPFRVFGVPLHQLATGDGKVPLVVDRLITTIEMYGLYMEGIYRKSGVSSKVRELKARMEEDNIETVQFEHYQVHVLASVLKSFLREMPEPLLTFDCYEDFLRAANLPEDSVSSLFAILRRLPKPNYHLMERLIFHLARVASHEDVNRMNSSALAIVFAPCILRTNKAVPAQDSLNDIARQTKCIEIIVSEQLRKLRNTLADIDTLDTAAHTATHRLSSLRSSKIFTPEELLPQKTDLEEEILMGHIEELRKEKAILTSTLPSLTRTTSDDDLLSTDDGSLDDVDTQPQPLSRHRNLGQKRCKRPTDPLPHPHSNSQDFDEDPIMV
ncbi:unconventional myosin-IXa-like isoform X1 [Macrosteles quadrilineatus]|uniref:unconventional myosin-IXa-like isoform X1 n=1 Tax=Macrosteles quadrilineatus TaxID=74068 RepID=UPI0023E2AB79|nr:unconventional myosin-IXa-like isoform X1 [Macrosteles quadrilineatus]